MGDDYELGHDSACDEIAAAIGGKDMRFECDWCGEKDANAR